MTRRGLFPPLRLLLATALLTAQLVQQAHAKKDPSSSSSNAPTKVGAGFFFVTPDGSALLLLRSGKNNYGKWGLPGGNAEPADGSLLSTARREVAEELGGAGSVPKYTLAGEPILTRRGKGGLKHFTVFVARVPGDAKAALAASRPRLQAEEVSAWRWFTMAQLDDMAEAGELHPVVELLVERHRAELEAAAGLSARVGSGGGGGGGGWSG